MTRDGSTKSLSPLEVLRVTFASEILGIDQHDLAAMYGTNPGRIAEAIVAMRWAMENHKQVYRYTQRLKGRAKQKKPDNGLVDADMLEAQQLIGIVQ